jgi:hypothetical protein
MKNATVVLAKSWHNNEYECNMCKSIGNDGVHVSMDHFVTCIYVCRDCIEHIHGLIHYYQFDNVEREKSG